MEGNILKRHLFRFLKDRGLFRPFCAAFSKPSQANIRVTWCHDVSAFKKVPNASLDDFCEKINDGVLLINYAFDWSKTRQGHEFWENISCNWRHYIRNIMNDF
jgi:hypothetical protein